MAQELFKGTGVVLEYCILAQELFYNIAYWHRRCFIILHIGTGDVLEYCLLAQEMF